MYLAILPIFTFVAGIVALTIYNTKQNKRKQEILISTFGNSFLFNKKFVRADVFTSGRKNTSLIFNACHIYTTDDALLIFGYKDLGIFTIEIVPLILTNNPQKYYYLSGSATIIKPKKFNLNSFNSDVYIEYGESGWQTTNVEIRLIKLTPEEKQHLLFLQ